MEKEKNFIKTRGALLRKYGAIEMATGDSFIKATLDSSKEYIDVKDAPELSKLFGDVIRQNHFTLSGVRGSGNVINYLLVHNSFFRSSIPANKVGLTIMQAFSWAGLMQQRVDDGRRMIDVLLSNTSYYDVNNKRMVTVSPLSIFKNDGTHTLETVMDAVDAYCASIPTLQIKSVPANLSLEKLNKSTAHETVVAAVDLIENCHAVFGTFEENVYIPPVAQLFNLLVKVQKEDMDSLQNFGLDTSIFNTELKTRIELPRVLEWKSLKQLILDLGKALIVRDAFVNYKKINNNITNILADVNNSFYMGASLFSVDCERVAEQFLEAANSLQASVVEVNYTYQRFEKKVEKLSDYLFMGAVADSLGYSGNDNLIFNEPAALAFNLFLSSLSPIELENLNQKAMMTKQQYDELRFSMTPVMNVLIRILSSYDEISFEDVRGGFKAVVTGELGSRKVTCLERTVLHEDKFFACHPVFARERLGTGSSAKLALTSFNSEAIKPGEYIPDILGIRVNHDISADDFRTSGAGAKYSRLGGTGTVVSGTGELLAETFSADTTEFDCIPNTMTNSVSFSKKRAECFWVCPAMHTRSLGETVHLENVVLCTKNEVSGLKVTKTLRVDGSIITALSDPSQASAYLEYFFNIMIKGHTYAGITFAGSGETDPNNLMKMYADVVKKATSTTVLFDEPTIGLDSEFFDEVFASSDSNASIGDAVIVKGTGAAIALTGADLVKNLNPMIGELELLGTENKEVVAKIFRVIVTTFIPTAAKSLLEGGPARYSKCVPNGTLVDDPKVELTFNVPALQLPSETYESIKALGPGKNLSISNYGRVVSQISLKRDKDKNLVNDDRFGSIALIKLTLNDHGNPEKSNFVFAGPGSFKKLFSVNSNAFYYPRFYGVSSLDNVAANGNIAPTIRGTSVLGERADNLSRANTLILDYSQEPIEFESLIVPKALAKAMELKIAEAERTLAIDIIDEKWIRISAYIGLLVASCYALIQNVYVAEDADTFDFNAYKQNINDFIVAISTLSDTASAFRFGLCQDDTLTVKDLKDLATKALADNSTDAAKKEEDIAKFLKALKPGDYETIKAVSTHGLDICEFPICTTLDLLSSDSGQVTRLLSDDINYYITYHESISSIKGFGEEAIGPALSEIIKRVASRCIDYRVTACENRFAFGLAAACASLPTNAKLVKSGSYKLVGSNIVASKPPLLPNFIEVSSDSGKTWSENVSVKVEEDHTYTVRLSNYFTTSIVGTFKVKDGDLIPVETDPACTSLGLYNGRFFKENKENSAKYVTVDKDGKIVVDKKYKIGSWNLGKQEVEKWFDDFDSFASECAADKSILSFVVATDDDKKSLVYIIINKETNKVYCAK